MKWIEFRELCSGSSELADLPSLKAGASTHPQEREEEIVRYLETAPSYSALGKIVADVLDPSARVVLFPGWKTDGLYAWPNELSYYVRKYHVRVPQDLVERMSALAWQPPKAEEIDWEAIGLSSTEGE